MAISFPSSPALNQQYTYGSRTWSWNGVAWQSVGTAQGLQGTQGLQGSQGTQGVQGIQGIQGSSYTGPTLGQTYLASAQTISGVQGLTLQNTTLQGTLIAGGVVGTAGYLLTSTGTGVQWAPAPVSLPSQTGYALQFLTTNGTTASWTPVYYQSVATAATTGVAGTPSTARPKLTFIGATLSDDSANNQTTVTITSGGNAEINTIMGVY